PTFENTIDPNCFNALKSRVIQIRFVDHLTNLRYRFVRNRKTPDKRLESAVVAMVRELSIQHVEGDGARHSIRTWREHKLRLPINELRDQPSRADTLDLGPRPREPWFALVLLRIEHCQLSRATAAFGATEQHRDIVPACTLEEIDLANFTELSRKALQFCSCRLHIHFFAPPDETLKRLSQFGIICRPAVIEHRDPLLFAQALDFLRPNQRGITSVVTDLLCQPLKLLVLHGLVRKQICRCFDLHCAHLLQASPHGHSLG